MELVFLVVAIVFGAVVSIVLAINMRMSGEIARLRGELAELERSRTEISGMLSETRDAVGNADRLMKYSAKMCQTVNEYVSVAVSRKLATTACREKAFKKTLPGNHPGQRKLFEETQA